MKKVCLIGQFPPPVHGLSKALDTIIKSGYMNNKYELEHINIKDNKKFVGHLTQLNRSDADIYYFTISHSKFGNLRDMIILWALLKKKKRVIIHYHGGRYKELYQSLNILQKQINRKLIDQTDIVIVLGNSLKGLFSDVIDAGKIRICENYIEDEALLDNFEFEIKINRLYQGDMEVLYLSNFIKSKGYQDVLQAANRLKNANVRFHFAGKFFEEQDKEEFMDYVKQHGLENNVLYHGVVMGEDKKKLFERCNIFVLPTYYPNEGQPISIIEAMGNGLSIITTNHAGIPDIVSSRNGYIIDKQAPDQIASAIQELMNNREYLVQHANENRLTTLMKFKEIDYIKRLESIMDEVS
ncbi:glycosyltransferase family 4 protein [Paenibacillus sacheonensis]|uniref:Glycosyltransferase n=1 Tax=Paenibacillus sacheonensis TaxID=742054 RepID=A0A7X4YP48_9BACL|nr:glycosyltransferase family 4 protein [Paenibacillus sacheonensis]MBM7567323.1 glycosyltransferase involved in cell wall biosynthesis [Paenibacillus sacheonensis]NBC69893.1 glycosyltransferase [Paenibacillus sacheonensis]